MNKGRGRVGRIADVVKYLKENSNHECPSCGFTINNFDEEMQYMKCLNCSLKIIMR